MRNKRMLIYGFFIILMNPNLVSRAVYGLSFEGTASGGTLILADTPNRTPRYITIQTTPGESADSVAHRLANKINLCHSIAASLEGPQKFNPQRLWVGGFQAEASGGTVTLGGGAYILAGTEIGLNIPKAPLFLSCSYDKINEKIVLQWENPPEGYDSILVLYNRKAYDLKRSTNIIGTSTNFLIDIAKDGTRAMDVNDMDFWLIGIRDDVPSNAAAINLSNQGYCQGELHGIPFSHGIAPNWNSWSTSPKANSTAFEQGEKYAELPLYNPAIGFLTKPFYQVIKAPPPGVVHGVYRKFLGLTPGHTYRLTACLTTLEMDSVNEDWSFSLCATHNGPDGKDLTIQQLAGLAPLPDGRSGPQAGRIASYSQGNTTKGDFSIVFSDVNAEPQSSHITLPAGADTITVWLRFSCSDPKGKIGLSGVKLEDISANPNPKSLEQVQENEFKEESYLIKRIERASRR